MNTRTKKMFSNLRININKDKKKTLNVCDLSKSKNDNNEDFSTDDSVRDPTFTDCSITHTQSYSSSSSESSTMSLRSKKRKIYKKRVYKKKPSVMPVAEELITERPGISCSPGKFVEIENQIHIPAVNPEELDHHRNGFDLAKTSSSPIGHSNNVDGEYLDTCNVNGVTKSSSSSSSSSSNSSSSSSCSNSSPSSSSESDDEVQKEDAPKVNKLEPNSINGEIIPINELEKQIEIPSSCNSISDSEYENDACDFYSKNCIAHDSVEKNIIPKRIESSSPSFNSLSQSVEISRPDFDTQNYGNKKTKQICIVPYDSSSSDEDFIAAPSPDDNLNSNVAGVVSDVTDNVNINTHRQTSSRKRKAETNNWIRNKAKRLRNSGQSYISSSNRVVPKRSVKPPCNEKCKLKCSYELTEIQRNILFNNYWNMSDLQRQREYILRHISAVKPRYSYKVHNSNRGHNNAYYFTIDQRRVRVCKQFFKATLDITDRTIKTVTHKIETDNDCSFLAIDQRGKHQNHKSLDPEIKESVRQHINSIPKIESHYCRADSKRQYIDGGKSIADLHRDYVDNRKQEDLPYANYLMFNLIFKNEYNISFMTPKKDQCEDCAAFSNASEEEKLKLKDKFDTHINEKMLSRAEKENDKKYTPDNCIVAVYDLQATMPCPRGDVSTYYYLSKLSVFNFTICDIKHNNVSCYVWHEAEGKRGVNEIATCVLKYIESLEPRARSLESKLDLIFYSDNCCGQQKNHFMIGLYVYAVNHFEYINSITHKFLIKGHTQNEGDNAHSVIERSIKKALKSGPIYTPDQYFHIIRTAKKTGIPYHVTEMSHSDFIDIKYLTSTLGKNYTKNTDNQTVKIGEIKTIKADHDETNKNSFFYKTSYSESAVCKKVIIDTGKTNTRMARNTTDPLLKRVYTQRIPVAEQKKNGLLGLINKNIVPGCYRSFYENL